MNCPKCGNSQEHTIKQTRLPYCGINDDNYIDCECMKCGHKWELVD
jgi:C4-type Zn-finger protein